MIVGVIIVNVRGYYTLLTPWYIYQSTISVVGYDLVGGVVGFTIKVLASM